VRDRPRDVGKVHRLVAPRLGLRLEVARQQIGRIGFEHQPIGRNARHGGAQLRAAPFVANPAGDAYAKSERQVLLELGDTAGKAMSHSADETSVEVPEDGLEIVVGVPLMKKYRLRHCHGDFQLRDECDALRRRRREIAVVVEAAFSHRNHVGLPQQGKQFLAPARFESHGMVRVNAGGAPQDLRMRGSQGGGCMRTREIRAGDDLPRDAGGGGPFDHFRSIVRKAFVRQVRADIDQFYVQVLLPSVYLDYMLRARLHLASFLLPLCLAAATVHAQRGGDLQAQILYAFQSEDINELASLIQTLRTQVQAGTADSALRYHLAHADYRLALLSGETQPRNAEPALNECIDQLKPILEQDADSVEALALQSACYSNLVRYKKKFEAVLYRSRAADRIRAAFKLAPKNPRVLYLSAIDALARANPGSPESSLVLEQLELASQLFEQSSATTIESPSWGHAEAYLELGRQLQLRGDVLGARNWIEKALIMAPDYKAARRQLATLVHS
jgi:hypothetical protein